MKSLLGEGGFAYVYLVTDASTGEQLCLKRMLIGQSSSAETTARAEMRLMEMLRHQNIVNFVSSAVSGSGRGGRVLYARGHLSQADLGRAAPPRGPLGGPGLLPPRPRRRRAPRRGASGAASLTRAPRQSDPPTALSEHLASPQVTRTTLSMFHASERRRNGNAAELAPYSNQVDQAPVPRPGMPQTRPDGMLQLPGAAAFVASARAARSEQATSKKSSSSSLP